MFAKSILFTSLLVGSFFIFVNVKNSEALDPDPDFRLVRVSVSVCSDPLYPESDSNFARVKKSNPLDPIFAQDSILDSKKNFFVDAVKQLKAGEFDELSHRGMLLCGPYEEGKK
ncbi:MAG TPA: hypothetical protein ENI08_01120 [Candidatus Dependentiae bacterium]|nr:hypothetical protein [Candidatus Dependentiae bacterium]